MLKNASKCTHNAWDCFQSARKRLLEWKWWEAGTGKGAYFSVSITAARAKISASRLPGTKNVTIWVRGPKTASWSRNFEKFLELDHVLMDLRGTFQNHVVVTKRKAVASWLPPLCLKPRQWISRKMLKKRSSGGVLSSWEWEFWVFWRF